MGRGRGKGKKLNVTSHEDVRRSEEEKIPTQKRRGRPQKPLKDDIDEEEYGRTDDNNDDDKGTVDLKAAVENVKKRKRNSQVKDKPCPVKEEKSTAATSSAGDSTKPSGSGFRHIRSRRKSTPHRAAEVGVKGTIFLGLEASPRMAGISIQQ